jgi:hypothetical protein
MPFLLLPFRPTSDPSAARTFIRHFFDRGQTLYGETLAQELRLTEPMVRINQSVTVKMADEGNRFFAALLSGAGADYREELYPGRHMSCSK